MGVILHCDKYTKIERMLHALRFMSVKQRLHYTFSIFIYKILNGTLPRSLRNKIEKVGSENQRCTREAGNIVLGFRKRGMHRKVYFTKELNCIIPYH